MLAETLGKLLQQDSKLCVSCKNDLRVRSAGCAQNYGTVLTDNQTTNALQQVMTPQDSESSSSENENDCDTELDPTYVENDDEVREREYTKVCLILKTRVSWTVGSNNVHV